MPTFTAQGSMFEGLFGKVLKPNGAFRDELKTVGFDVERIQPEYPMQVWVDCLDVTAKHRHPGVERFAAWRLIGRDFITGFLETIAGRLVAVAFPFLSPKTLVDRSPRFMRLGVKELEAKVTWRSANEAHLTLNGPHLGAAHLLAGVVEVCFERLKVKPTISAKNLDGIDGELVVTWS